MKYLPVPAFILMSVLFWAGCEDTIHADKNPSASSDRSLPTINRVPLSENLKMMQGTWKLEGSNQQLQINRRKYVLTNGDSTLLDATVEAYANCPGFCSLGGDVSGISCFVVKGEYDATCYAIMKLSDTSLICSLIGGKGEVLTFKRNY